MVSGSSVLPIFMIVMLQSPIDLSSSHSRSLRLLYSTSTNHRFSPLEPLAIRFWFPSRLADDARFRPLAILLFCWTSYML